jgi:competence protein ComEC
MEPALPTPRPVWPTALLRGAACAVAGALLGRAFGLPGAAAAGSIAALLSLRAAGPGPCLLALPAALAAAPLAAPALQDAWPRAGPVRIDARVCSGIDLDPVLDQQRFWVERDGQRALCIVSGACAVLPGDRLRGPARLDLRANAAGLPPLATLQARADGLAIRAGPPSFRRVSEACRLALERSLLASTSGTGGDLLCHLVLGRGPRLPDALTAAHRASGVSHLLAVSGAHASMLAAMLAWCFARARRAPLASRAYRRVCAVLLVLYCGITGMEPPVLRAVLAFLVVLLGTGQGRRVGVAAALALPALVTALFMPDELLGPSFCLSYAAVIGLSLSGALRLDSWLDRWVRMPLSASLWATLTTAPLTLLFFGQLAPWTIVATPLLAPLVALMLAGGLIVATLGLLWPGAAALLAVPLQALTNGYCGAVYAFAQLPGAPILSLREPGVALLLAAALLGAAAIARWPGRRGVAFACAALVAPHFLPPPAPAAALHLLAVGHGQACLTHLPDGRTVLVDCGALGEARRAAHRTARALLPRRRIDVLIVTHADHDHAGGIPALLERVAIAQAMLPADMLHGPTARALRAHGTALLGVDDGEQVALGDRVRLWRPRLPAASRNERSLWVRLDCAGLRVLLTGDALAHGVRAWLDGPDAGRADVLVLPHHGRRLPAARALLHTVRPRLALVSNAAEPTCEQAPLAAELGIPLLETGVVGSIAVAPDGDGLRIVTERELRLR